MTTIKKEKLFEIISVFVDERQMDFGCDIMSQFAIADLTDLIIEQFILKEKK